MRDIRELTTEEIALLIKDDVVRPHLSAEFRTDVGRKVLALFEGAEPQAVVCLSFGYGVPTNEDELVSMAKEELAGEFVIVPYTLWSYTKGAGTDLINAVLEIVRAEYGEADEKVRPRIVTMSPKTKMAQSFHIKNGAKVLSRNKKTNNFEYTL
jgi:hypothetical protein|tara:strand:- start:2702 stop:3163 length:462 start_codon:yes stop_codon:yes gene_type:complete